MSLGALLLVFGAVAVVATAWLVVRHHVEALTGRVLAAYAVGFAEVILVTLALSAVGGLRRWTLLGTIVVLLLVALVATRWERSGVRARPDLRESLAQTFADPIVVVLGVAVAAGLVYSAALLLFTPPNDWDALTYHLARAAFWIQAHGVGYIPDSDVLRINVNPPNGEIGLSFTLLLAESDQYAGVVQYLAALMSAIGVFGLARRFGMSTREGAFGAFAFLSLPVVLLQSSSALNDVVVASFLVVATYFLLGRTRVELALGATALALALGTKFTAFIALPLLALVVLVGQSPKRRPAAALAGMAGLCAGSYWIAVNLVETGRFDGGAGDILEQHPDRGPAEIPARSTRMLVNFADDLNLDRDLWAYPLVALVVAIAVVATARGRRTAWLVGAALAAVGCVPLLVGTFREFSLRVHEKLWLTLGRSDLAYLDVEREALSPSTVRSYYGPLGLVLLLAGIISGVVAWRRGAVRGLVVLLAGAPAIIVVLVASALVYDPWRARFLLFGMALAASTWGLVLRYRWVAWGAVCIAATTILLAFVHSLEKPMGVRILDDETATGIWGESRVGVQTWLRPDGTAEVVDFFARQPEDGRVGLVIGEDDWVYPYFGRGLGRAVVFADPGRTAESLDWLVVRPAAGVDVGPAWALERASSDGWRIYRRARAIASP